MQGLRLYSQVEKVKKTHKISLKTISKSWTQRQPLKNQLNYSMIKSESLKLPIKSLGFGNLTHIQLSLTVIFDQQVEKLPTIGQQSSLTRVRFGWRGWRKGCLHYALAGWVTAIAR